MCLCVTVFDTTFVIYLPKYPSCCLSLFKAVKTSRGASDRNMCVYSARHRVCPWRSKMWGTLLQIRLSNGFRCLITGEHRRRGGWHRVLGGGLTCYDPTMEHLRSRLGVYRWPCCRSMQRVELTLVTGAMRWWGAEEGRWCFVTTSMPELCIRYARRTNTEFN